MRYPRAADGRSRGEQLMKSLDRSLRRADASGREDPFWATSSQRREGARPPTVTPQRSRRGDRSSGQQERVPVPVLLGPAPIPSVELDLLEPNIGPPADE